MPINFKGRRVLALSPGSLTGYDAIILNHWQVIDWAVRSKLQDKINGCVFAMIRDIEQWADYNTIQQCYFRTRLNFIAVSSWVADIVTGFNGRATPVVKNGLNFDIFYTKTEFVPRSLMSLKIGVIINDHPMKDMKRLAGILNLFVGSSDRCVEIEAVGKSREFASELNVSVEYLGVLSSQALADFYRRQDIFVFTSIQEGWGNPPLEALACGCNVVSTDVGGLQSIDRSKYQRLHMLEGPRDDERDVKVIQRVVATISATNDQYTEGSQRVLQSDLSWEASCDQLEKILRAGISEQVQRKE
jgi:glycosyltransferase involved in cell wall biosynthesis